MAKNGSGIVDVIPDGIVGTVENVRDIVGQFVKQCDPLERALLHVLVDARTNARYCECHMRASRIVALATVDVPLDPDEQAEYRANREIVEDHVAFRAMKEDALQRRTFSNIVAEYTTAFDPECPIKIIGGQHRFTAIKEALDANSIDEFHGLKMYFGLNPDQRLDVQLISNTNIDVSADLFDRMQETLTGPELRRWCQDVGLLEPNTDFADRRQRGKQITVKAARTFIVNYFRGLEVDDRKFDQSDTTPIICKTGVADPDWDALKKSRDDLWTHAGLLRAGKEFAALVQAQRNAFSGGRGSRNVDFAEKALNFAIIAGWAYVAGLLAPNEKRLERLFSLRNQANRDPLNAAALVKGRHKSDSESYRGLGYRTDARERGRFVELFYLQGEKGSGIDKSLVDLAIKKFHAKRAVLEVVEAEQALP